MRNANGKPKDIVRATFEVPRDLYDTFMRAAWEQDLTGSQEIRRFMREYVETPKDTIQSGRAA